MSKLLTVPEYAKLRGVAFSTVYGRLKIPVPGEQGNITENPKGDIEVELDEKTNLWMIDPAKNKHVTFKPRTSRKKLAAGT